MSVAMVWRMAKFKPREEQVIRPSEDSTLPAMPMLDAEQVAEKAYERYMSRGGADGQDLDDWYLAEQELIRDQKPNG
jgi:hypothetical protein